MSMKFKLHIACAALLASVVVPASALELGQIQVKSALNQPLVASIPLHPGSLSELDGLTVGLAPADDYKRAGLQITAVDQTLRFHVTTDNNGQKLILVTSDRPITEPYLDFLVQVNTRQGKQVQEFVVLLNPVIAAPSPAVQGAQAGAAVPPPAPEPVPPPPPEPQLAPQPAPSPPPAPPPAAQPAPRLAPPPLPAPPPRPVPQLASPPPQATPTGGTVSVVYGDTLSGIASQEARGSGATVNQMMLALKAANPEAFFRDNINDLKAGAILRIPTRDEIDRTSIAEANAEVHRQYEAWRASRPHPATVVEGTAVEAAASATPRPGKVAPASDRLTLVPPSGGGGGVSNRPGVAGGKGTEALSGVQQHLQNDRATLVSLNQANADLESRVRSLEDITAKSERLLSIKDATIAELQRKLAATRSAGTSGAGIASTAGSATPKPVAATAPSARASGHPAAPHMPGTPWYMQPLTWIVAGVVALALILIGWLRRRRAGSVGVVAGGRPLPDPEDVSASPSAIHDEEATLRSRLAENPADLASYLALCRLYYAQGNEPRFVETAHAMHAHVADPDGADWREVKVMGAVLAPHLALFEIPGAKHADPYGIAALRQPREDRDMAEHALAPEAAGLVLQGQDGGAVDAAAAPDAGEPDEDPMAVTSTPLGSEPAFSDDPVDTKLDLARAYLDMGDPVGARAMLEEVLEDGSQTQKDQARRMLADVAG